MDNHFQSVRILRGLYHLGVRKVITTPHIRHDLFPNTPQMILAALDGLKEIVRREGIKMEVEAAAEYFIDEHFLSTITSGEQVLYFGNKYVLIETSFINKPVIFQEIIFELTSRGFKPVLAHPERYQYLESDLSWLKSIHKSGVLFQITAGSVAGAYGKTPARTAIKLIREKLVDFIGSDIHKPHHIEFYQQGMQSKYIKTALKGNLLNEELI